MTRTDRWQLVQTWLEDAIVYEIYPQSFADSDGDGIGDFPGVLARLDHLQWLGVNTIWFNPCFASPFVDAGYDVSDYLTVAPRYGTNDDLIAVVDAARERGIRVILDLVAGHTSDQHPWFLAELAADGPDPAGDRYIWADQPGNDRRSDGAPGESPWVPSPGPRPGYYLKNFYDQQPALNFGYAVLAADQPWREPPDAPGPSRNRQALRDIMAFWLDRGVAGFRVDMAFSLVKDDAGYARTVQLWRELKDWLEQSYPDAVLIPEGFEPVTDEPFVFDADFFLVILDAHRSLFDNGAAGSRPTGPIGPCFFDAAGLGSTDRFLADWAQTRSRDAGRTILLASADHDYSRLAMGDRTPEQLGAAFTFLLTWGSVPSIYYGDEIGLRFRPGLPDTEGSEIYPGYYNRAGVRTPMQWNDGPNAGFSTAPADRLYLPVADDADRPTVAAQRADPDSTLHLVRRLIQLRRATPALGGRACTRVLHADYPLVYLRDESHLVVVNPRREPATVELGIGDVSPLLNSGIELVDGVLTAAGFGYGVFELGAPVRQ